MYAVFLTNDADVVTSLYMGSTSVLQNYASVTALHEVLVEFPLELQLFASR